MALFPRQYLALLVATFTCISILLGLPANASSISVRVLSVRNGNIIDVAHDHVRMRIILEGVDAPALGQAFGHEARQFIKECCFRKTVRIEEKGRDQSGNTIAVVYLEDGTNLNRELVKHGLAWVSFDKNGAGDILLQKLQASAKAAHLGLWVAPNPTPPWIFRSSQQTAQTSIKRH